MPTLLEIERALYDSLMQQDRGAADQHIVANGLAPETRLDVYRNTLLGVSTNALRLSFPAIQRLVGGVFFDHAARTFIETDPPRSAYLNDYGARFPAFLEDFPPAASLAYLPGVARLEWAVSRALHAPDVEALDVSDLSTIDEGDHHRVSFVPHPSVGLVRADHPVDEIWRAVLAQDDAAMAAIDLNAGPVHLLAQRFATGTDVSRLDEPEWHFLTALGAGRPLEDAIGMAPGGDPGLWLAEHLAAGRFVRVELIGHDRDNGDNGTHPQEAPA